MVIGMTELSSALDSLRDLGNKQVSILFSEQCTTVLFSSLLGEENELLIELKESSLLEALSLLAPKGRDFHSISIVSANPQVTFIPDGLFDESKASLYLNSVFGDQRSRMSLLGHVSALSLHYVFGIDADLESAIQKTFPQARVKHLCEALLIEAWAGQDHSDKVIFRLHQEGDSLFLFVLQGKEVKLFTHHRIGDATDVVYHSLNTIHDQGLDHDKAILLCSGSLSSEYEGFELLKSYCPQCYFKPAEFAAALAPHQFILASQHYCE